MADMFSVCLHALIGPSLPPWDSPLIFRPRFEVLVGKNPGSKDRESRDVILLSSNPRCLLSSGQITHRMTPFTLGLFLSHFSYIDPNTGGLMFQLLFPILVAIGGAWVVFRRKIGGICKRLSRRRNKKDEARQ